MSRRVFAQARPNLEQGVSIGRKLTRLLSWGAGAVAVALAVAGCGGGGGGDATPAVAASAQPNQVAAFALTQQSVTTRLAPPQAVALAAVASDSLGNMLLNGGFESGMTGWANWGNASAVSGQASSGTWALSVGTAAGGAGQVVGGVVPGAMYRLTAQARVSVVAEMVYVGVNFLDQSGEPLTQNAVPFTSTAYATATFEVVAPPNAANALVYVWKNASSGPAYVDDISFAAVAGAASGPPSSGNLVTNGGFETALLTWTNWGNSASTAEAGAASWAAQVGIGAGGFGQQVAGVVAGNSYRVSALAKVSTPGEIGYLGVMFTDDAGNGLQVQNVIFRSTTYSTIQADVTAPANATRALVFVWKNAGTGFALVDEVALVQVIPGTGTDPAPTTAQALVAGQLSLLSKPGTLQAIGGLDDGGYAVMWCMSCGTASFDLVTQRFASNGSPVGLPVHIPFTEDAATHHYAGAGVLPDGSLMVAYGMDQVDVPNNLVRHSLYVQRHDPSGAPLGGPVEVAFFVHGLAGSPITIQFSDASFISWSDGSYALKWVRASRLSRSTTGPTYEAFVQRYDAAGTATGTPRALSWFYEASGSRVLGLTALDDGGYLAAIEYSPGPPSPMTVHFVPYDSPDRTVAIPLGAAGLPTGSSVIALSGGGYALLSSNQAGPYAQILDNAGAFVAEPAVHAGMPYALSDGGFAVVWVEGFAPAGAPAVADPVAVQRYDATGLPLGDPTRVGPLAFVPQDMHTSAASLSGIRLALTFTLNGDANGGGLYTQLLREADAPKRKLVR